MKLRSQVSRQYKGKEYRKWILNPPTELIEKLGWQDGMELEAVVRKGQLVLRPAPVDLEPSEPQP